MRDMLAYIPARGGSKRLARKNIRPLGGVPVLARVIGALRACSFLHAVCVSTDDAEIGEVARSAGAITLEPRSAHLSDDHATFMDLLRGDVPRFLEHHGIAPATAQLCFVLPTAALLTADVLESGYTRFQEAGAPLLVASLPMPVSPYRALARTQGGRCRALFPHEILQRTQDMAPTFYDSGLFYFMKYARMAAYTGHWFAIPEGIECFELSPHIAIDVDTPEDWERLEREFQKPPVA